MAEKPLTFTVAVTSSAGGVALARTLDSILRQTSCGSAEIIVGVDAAAARVHEGIAAIAAPTGARLVSCEGATPGAALNRCVGAGSGKYAIVLDEGDGLPDTALAAAEIAFGGGASVAALCCTPCVGFAQLETRRPTAGDLEQALAEPHTAPAAFLFRRADWERMGGYDERLRSLIEYEFCLRLLERGKVAVLDIPPIRRQVLRTGRLRREWEPEDYEHSLALVLERHRPVLQRDPARYLAARERDSAALLARHRALVARRDDAVRRTREARERVLDLRGFLRGHGHDRVDLGELQHAFPVSRDWGYDRGTPVDRVFIERFIADHAADVRGRVLEIQEGDLSKRFGGRAVTRIDVLDIAPQNPRATVIGDLRRVPDVPDDTYDCILLTQTLHVIDDMVAVLRECRRMLKAGGALLVTFPCASRVCVEYGPDGDFWRATEAGVRRLVASVFGERAVSTVTLGNVLTTTAFVQGLAAHELPAAKFDEHDPSNPTLIGVRALKAASGQPGIATAPRTGAAPRGRAVILLYHRVGTYEHDLHGLAVPRERFSAQMAHLAAKYVPMLLDELIDAGVQRRLPHRAVAVTFDDGYADNLESAVPVLDAHGIPAAFFIPGSAVDGGREYWWDTLARGLGADRAAHDAIYRRIVRGSAEEIDQAIDRLCAERGVARAAPQTLTRAQLLELASHPLHTIGAHGMRHLYLPAQAEKACRGDLVRGRRTLEDLLGRAVRWLAYPFGAYDQGTGDAARAAGFDGALTCDARAWTEGDDVYRIPRVDVQCESLDAFDAELGRYLE